MNLLERTRKLLQGFTPAPLAKTQYYNVSCPEGHRLRGERTEGYQALRCPTCGAGIFVLPRSPLPLPAAPDTPNKSPRPAAKPVPSFDEGPIALKDPVAAADIPDLEPVGEIEWIDDPAMADADVAEGRISSPASIDSLEPTTAEQNLDVAARPTPAARSPKPSSPGSAPVRKSSQAPTQNRSQPIRADRPEIDQRFEVLTPFSERLKDWAKRHRNPLIFLSVVLIVVCTVGYRIGRSRFQELPRVAEIGREQGLPALDAGKFDAAQQLLSEASRAVDALGGQVEGASEIRQGAREAAIYSNLCPDSLETVLTEAAADPKERETRFNSLYRGRSIIIDSYVVAAPEESGKGHYDLEYRVLPTTEGSKRVGRIDLSQLQLFEDAPRKVGDHVIIGVRLRDLALDAETGDWLFTLDPASGVDMTHAKALESIGWPTELESVGEEQR